MLRQIFYGLALLLAACLGGGAAWLDHRLAESLHELTARLPPGLELGYAEAGFTWNGDLRLEKWRLKAANYPPLGGEEARLHRVYTWYPPDRLPASARLTLSRLGLPWLDNPRTLEAFWPPPALLGDYAKYHLTPAELVALGLGRLGGDLELRLSRDPEQPEKLNFELNLALDNLADLILRGSLRYPKPPDWTVLSHTAPGNIRLAHLQLSYQDRGGLARIFGYLANRENSDSASLRGQLAEQAGRDLPMLGLGKQVVSEIQRWLREGELSLALNPSAPLSWAELSRQSPSDYPRLLGLARGEGRGTAD